MKLTVKEIQRKLSQADSESLPILERALISDERKGVVTALRAAQRRVRAHESEARRMAAMREFEQELLEQHGATIAVGLDEVGRGALAGPLAVGAVVLAPDRAIDGLNDSKQLTPQRRKALAAEIKATCRGWSVQYIDVATIDAKGIMFALRQAFVGALAAIERQSIAVDLVLIDGNHLDIDPREVNIIKGDARCPSIAAASIVAKVERDQKMVELSCDFPAYHFDENKGYGSHAHLEALKTHGLSPLHRRSYCGAYLQPTLFEDIR